MNKKLKLTAVMTSALLLVTACSSGNGSSDSGSSESESASGDSIWQEVEARGTIKTCAVDGLLPYSSSDESNPGLEIEMADELAQLMGLENETVWVGTWDGLIPSLTSGQCDAIVDGFFITEERQKSVDFSNPTWGSGEVIVVREGDDRVSDLDDLKDVCVGVLQGSVTVDHLEEAGIPAPKVYPSQNEILLDLSNGGCDAAYLESPSAGWSLREAPEMNLEIVESFESDEMYWEGIAVQKNQPELLEHINKAIEQIHEDGTLAEILEKYGVPVYLP